MAPLLLATVTTTLRLDLFIVPRPGFDDLIAPYAAARVALQRPATHLPTERLSEMVLHRSPFAG
ncbi:hypothetical protein AGR9A_Cc10024 [Agrobacterium salinitolerans str. Hayward 0363]|nr:hypothetical protein AGR9A_Cc10024 [Agrobacterium salinitolerans str. Hayward 0363]